MIELAALAILEYMVWNPMYMVVALLAWSVPQPLWAKWLTDKIKTYSMMVYVKIKSLFKKTGEE